jgi:enoyl-CoA hydratase
MISAPARSFDAPFDDGLVIEEHAGLVHVRLNRPAALNALSSGMIRGLGQVLDMAGERTILIHGEGRAFCAGGDIKMQASAIKSGDKAQPAGYFREEYALNAQLFHHKGPYVSYLNGIVMGGGYGVSAHGSHLVTCEGTAFAMPEVKIGFFPDVGAVYHLARVPHELGTYMALTGNTVGAADMLFMGLAHAHVPAARFEKLAQGLQTNAANDVLASLHAAPDETPLLKMHQDLIARCFRFDDAAAIVDALKSDGSAFAMQTAQDIEARSPTSVFVALGHIRRARTDGFDTVIARDLNLSLRFLDLPDFPEGVRAAIIDKDRNPRWKPPSLADVDASMVALYLDSLGD